MNIMSTEMALKVQIRAIFSNYSRYQMFSDIIVEMKELRLLGCTPRDSD